METFWSWLFAAFVLVVGAIGIGIASDKEIPTWGRIVGALVSCIVSVPACHFWVKYFQALML